MRPLASCTGYIDDAANGSYLSHHRQVVELAVQAGRDFQKVAEQLGLRINDKLAVLIWGERWLDGFKFPKMLLSCEWCGTLALTTQLGARATRPRRSR